MDALAISNQPSVVAARFIANLHRRALIALLAVVSLCVVSMPARAADAAGMERALVSLLADPQLFSLTPKSAADKLAPFGRLKEDKQGGVALRTFYIDLQSVGRRAAVYFERSSGRLTNITLMFSPEDAIDAARVRAALARSLGTAQEWSQAGSNRVVWWEGADGRRVQLTLDPPDTEPAQLYIASVGREVSGRR
jgi:hypothetical protein